MRSEGYGMCVCVCACVFDATYSRTTHNKAANKRYQRVQCYTGLIFKMAIFMNPLRSKHKQKSQYVILPHLDRSLPPCTLWKHQKLLKGQVMSQRLHSNYTYEWRYPVGARNDRLSGWFWTIRICLQSHACIISVHVH